MALRAPSDELTYAAAAAMDPQQRLLLEQGYAAAHGAAQRRATLMGGDGGVFVGIERPDWALVQPQVSNNLDTRKSAW